MRHVSGGSLNLFFKSFWNFVVVSTAARACYNRLLDWSIWKQSTNIFTYLYPQTQLFKSQKVITSFGILSNDVMRNFQSYFDDDWSKEYFHVNKFIHSQTNWITFFCFRGGNSDHPNKTFIKETFFHDIHKNAHFSIKFSSVFHLLLGMIVYIEINRQHWQWNKIKWQKWKKVFFCVVSKPLIYVF